MANVAVLGTGAMRAAMAARLAECDHTVTVWGRDPADAAALTGPRIASAETVAEAGAAAEVVLTMVTDGPAVEQVAVQMLDAMPADRLRGLALSIPGPWWTRRCPERPRRPSAGS